MKSRSTHMTTGVSPFSPISTRSTLKQCHHAARTTEGQLKRKGSLLYQIFSFFYQLRKLTAGCRIRRGSKVRWQNTYLLPGVVALVVYGTMRLWFYAPFAYLLTTFATKPVVGQCPSYTVYSEVGTLDSCSSMIST